jgi:hypothetical protein
MAIASQLQQHILRGGGRFRLPQNPSVENHHRVGSEHPDVRVSLATGSRLLPGQPNGIVLRVFAGPRQFVDFYGIDHMRDAEHLQ